MDSLLTFHALDTERHGRIVSGIHIVFIKWNLTSLHSKYMNAFNYILPLSKYFIFALEDACTSLDMIQKTGR